ncbi:hypothetical protein AcW1_003564 [Taiwanofungus camphoratus]|nr:hypothetical protein AcV5_001974 [Antrodia cinnamomea]KAI0941764.1 hypothetical protein AcW1_003564 [Antrodia cinnamomea]
MKENEEEFYGLPQIIMPFVKAYHGQGRKLVLAIDVGTTYSGVSYCILDPGEVPKILSVTRYPGQEGENRSRDTKIPSVLYYSQEGEVRAVGAEARLDATRLDAMDEDWILVEWFKLHLRPNSMQLKDAHLPPMPDNKPVIQILADYLAYLYKCARNYISEAHPNGRQLLQSESDIEFVLSHPNGWGGSQQSEMRRAAVMAGLVPDTQGGQSRIHFVTEGEASLHFCITNGLAEDVIKTGNSLMIVDAGGGTVDLSTYRITNGSPVAAVESVAPDCLLQGSTFVNGRARSFLQGALKQSRFGNEEDIRTMLDYFESSTKPTFRNTEKPSYIKFGSLRDTDDKHDIKRGVLSLSGTEMAAFFRPSVQSIQQSIERQCKEAKAPVSIILLVGGFAASPFLRSQLQEYAQHAGLKLFCPENQPAKAVAEGALSSYLDHYVSARVARYAYGSRCVVPFHPVVPEHAKRADTVRFDASGSPVIPNRFSTILPKGTLVSEDKEFESSFCCESLEPMCTISSDIRCYRGNLQNPLWTDEEPDMFSTLCTIHADVSQVPKVSRVGLRGIYYRQSFKVILLFGLAELKAQLSWNDNGEEKRSPATIVYDREKEEGTS